MTGVLLSEDADILAEFPRADEGSGKGFFPRTDKCGQPSKLSWHLYHQRATDDIDRELRNRHAQPERFSMGQLGHRSRQDLRRAAACLALHYLFVDEEPGDSQNDYFQRMAMHFLKRARAIIEAEIAKLDYDSDASGSVSEAEEGQPFPSPFLRG